MSIVDHYHDATGPNLEATARDVYRLQGRALAARFEHQHRDAFTSSIASHASGALPRRPQYDLSRTVLGGELAAP